MEQSSIKSFCLLAICSVTVLVGHTSCNVSNKDKSKDNIGSIPITEQVNQYDENVAGKEPKNMTPKYDYKATYSYRGMVWDVEFYKDHILVGTLYGKYIGDTDGGKRYKVSVNNMESVYKVTPDYNMYILWPDPDGPYGSLHWEEMTQE